MAWLVSTKRGDEASVYPLLDRSLLGRESDCDIREVFSGRSWVSRRHALVERIGERFFVTDLGSRNGTRLNGRPLHGRTLLGDGDRLEIGGVELRFSTSDDGRAAKPRVPAGPDDDFDAAGIVSSRKITSFTSSGGDLPDARAERKLKSLLQLLGNLGRSLDADEMLDHLLSGLFDIFPQAARGFVATRSRPGEEVSVRKVKLCDEGVEERPPVSRTIIERVMREKEAILSIDASADQRFKMSDSVFLGKIRSVMCAPLMSVDGDVVGVLELDALDPKRRFDADDLEVFACLAPQAALALGYVQLHEEAIEHQALDHDLQLAHRVQQAILPKGAPAIQGYEFHTFYEAAHRVGGDYYDYVPLPDGRWAILIADAFGKGVSASLLAARISGELRSFLSTSATLAEALNRVSRSLCDMSEDLPARFATLVVALLDPRKHHLELVNAGHVVPILRRRDGRVTRVGDAGHGPALGMFPERTYVARHLDLGPGDVLFLYSDGFSEATNARGDMFGVDRICDVVSSCRGGAGEVGARVLEGVRAFVADERQSDDMCFLCLGRAEYNGPAVADPKTGDDDAVVAEAGDVP